MTRDEFLNKVSQAGIDLSYLEMVVGEKTNYPCIEGIYEENGKWFVYATDERYLLSERFVGNENDAFDKFYRYLIANLGSKRYRNKAVTLDVIFTEKDKVKDYLMQSYEMNDKEAEKAWEYLKQDMHALFEFKYYILNGDFVPDDYCYSVQGYSAKELFETTHLEVLGAFNYLVYLKRKPREALDLLKKGLPIK